ncbi:hypothetical protein HK102_009680 [Quaeritorhiza haematococci]|nr:hypothetical protein HK102_009680 [Quaeritorhiza haematococci]
MFSDSLDEDFTIDVVGELKRFHEEEIDGPLLEEDDRLDEEDMVTVGRIEGTIVQRGRLINEKAKERFQDVCTAHSEELQVMAETLFYSNGYVDEDVFADFDEDEGDILYISSISVDKPDRGKSLGLGLVKRFVDVWGGFSSLVIIQPYPKQFEYDAKEWLEDNAERLAKLTDDEKTELQEHEMAEATEKLVGYFEGLDFEQCGDTDYYYFHTLQWGGKLPEHLQ